MDGTSLTAKSVITGAKIFSMTAAEITEVEMSKILRERAEAVALSNRIVICTVQGEFERSTERD